MTDQRDSDDVEVVPAGGAGADSGAADTVGIDPSDTADVQNVSSQNDIPGVGTRASGGHSATDEEATAFMESGTAEPSGGSAPNDVQDSPVQDSPVMEGNERTIDDVLEAIVAQTRADVTIGSTDDARELLRQRLDDADLRIDGDAFDALARRVEGDADPVDLEPGVHP